MLASLERLGADDLQRLLRDWLVWARDDQLPPPSTVAGDAWRVWILLGGRGAGKTRAGAEWIRAQALGLPPLATEPASRIALVAETIAQARSVMVEGVSGLLAIHSEEERPHFEPSKLQMVWPNGTIAQIFSADDPDSLRGPQFAVAWCDELAKWRQAQRAWDMLQFGMRLGINPRLVVTTTPKPIPLVKSLLEDPTVVVSRARTMDNAANLPAAFIAEINRRYGDTALGRQEIFGEIIEERAGALWRRDWIGQHRVQVAQEMQRIVVAVDPPVTSNATSDACGIVVAGLGVDGRAYVLADRTIRGREPITWARAAVAAYEDFEADRIVAEVNQGGDLVVMVIRQVDEMVPVRSVRATRGKWLRAEPIAALYAEGRVAHVGEYPELEQQMCAFGAEGLETGRSPDRLDALVWALTDLMLSGPRRPAIRTL